MSLPTKSKSLQIRESLRDAIVAAGIGWSAEQIIIKRQSDFGNDVATAIASGQHRACMHIGIAEGTATEEDSLEIEVTIPIMIIIPPVPGKDHPEECLWEALVQFIHGRRLQDDDPYLYRFIFSSFEDILIKMDGGSAYLGRQTNFKYRLTLESNQ